MKILVVISLLLISINADIIELKVLKEKNKVIAKRITKDGEGTSYNGKIPENKKVIQINISNFWITKKEIIYKYNHFKVLNKKDIKKDFIIDGNKLKIYSNEKEYIETFIIEAKPDRPKYYWKIIEKKYKIYSTRELMKLLNGKEKEEYLKRLKLHEIKLQGAFANLL